MAQAASCCMRVLPLLLLVIIHRSGRLQAELHQLTGSLLRLTAELDSLLGSAELLETGIEARLATQHAIKAALQENTSRRFNQ